VARARHRTDSGPTAPPQAHRHPLAMFAAESGRWSMVRQRVFNFIPADRDDHSSAPGASGRKVVGQGGQEQIVPSFKTADGGLLDYHPFVPAPPALASRFHGGT